MFAVKTQVLYPLLLEYLVPSQVLIPMYTNNSILEDPFGHLYPMVAQGQLQLATWKVSGRTTGQQEIQKGLPSLYCLVGAKDHPTIQAGRNRAASVTEGELILFHVI